MTNNDHDRAPTPRSFEEDLQALHSGIRSNYPGEGPYVRLDTHDLEALLHLLRDLDTRLTSLTAARKAEVE